MSTFKFKQFDVLQSDTLQKIGTDAMVLGAITCHDAPKNILDVGTGTGVIALMLAQSFPAAHVLGLDIDERACDLAQANFRNSPFSSRLKTVSTSFLDFESTEKFDLIVSNPPYFNTTMYSDNEQRNLARHEGEMTLVKLLNHAAELLNETGKVWLILPAERTEELLADSTVDLFLSKRIEIYGKPNKHVRDILIYGKEVGVCVVESLTIREESGIYSEEYKELTAEFHFKRL